jgi:dihydroxyacetone kinase
MASAAKHVLNDPATLVVDSLKGLATLNPEVKFDEASRGELPLEHKQKAKPNS